jgi:inhibitor of cysteine peptidase
LLWADSGLSQITDKKRTWKDAMKTISAPTLSAPTLASWALAGCLVLLPALGACASGRPPPPIRTVSDADAGPVELVRGQKLEIALPMNAGTGYAWRLDREAPAWILSGGSSRTTTVRLPGGPVTMFYSYQAAGRGKAALSFTLKRPWEPDRPDDRKVVFQVKVR